MFGPDLKSVEYPLHTTTRPRGFEQLARRPNEKSPASRAENYQVGHVVTDVVELTASEMPPNRIELERPLHVGPTVAPDHSIEGAEVLGNEPPDALIGRSHQDDPPMAQTLFDQECQDRRPVGKAARVGQDRIGDTLLEPRTTAPHAEWKRCQEPGLPECEVEKRDLEGVAGDECAVEVEAERWLLRFPVRVLATLGWIHGANGSMAGQRANCVGAVGAKILNRKGMSTKSRSAMTREQMTTAVIRAGSRINFSGDWAALSSWNASDR